MEATRNLCAQIPISLHDKVREEKEALGLSLNEYVTKILKEYYEGGKNNMAQTKTLAFQISEELDQRLKNFLAAEKERTGKKVSQKEFVVGLIEQALCPQRTCPLWRFRLGAEYREKTTDFTGDFPARSMDELPPMEGENPD